MAEKIRAKQQQQQKTTLLNFGSFLSLFLLHFRSVYFISSPPTELSVPALVFLQPHGPGSTLADIVDGLTFYFSLFFFYSISSMEGKHLKERSENHTGI